jgi:hypothetical protein
MDTGEFRLSRIYSHGWNAAKRLLAERIEHVNAERAAKLNPCGAIEERARWTKGFEDGLRSSHGAAREVQAQILPRRRRPVRTVSSPVNGSA